MKMKHILLPLIAITLCGCSKTEKMYKLHAYESPYFNSNYYLKNDTKDFVFTEHIVEEKDIMNVSASNSLEGIKKQDRGGYVWEDPLGNKKEKLWGYHNNLGRIDESFKKGAISKLYDGRVRCDGLYQKSRAQLDKVGYDAKFPMTMSNCDYFAFSCRGGTTLETPLQTQLEYNFTLGFFTIDKNNPGQYVKHIVHLNGLKIDTDNSAKTDLVSFYVGRDENGDSIFKDMVAMSISWECNDPQLALYNVTDDRTEKEKDHLALMLYEVFFGNSTWYK